MMFSERQDKGRKNWQKEREKERERERPKRVDFVCKRKNK